MQTLTGTEVLYIHININDIYEKCELSYTHTHLVHWRVCICVSHVYTPGTFKCVQYMHLCVLWLWKQLKKAAPCENVSAQKKTHATLFSHQYSEHRSFNSILILYLLYPQRLFYCHFHCQHEYICSEGTQGCRLYSLVTRWQGTKKKKNTRQKEWIDGLSDCAFVQSFLSLKAGFRPCRGRGVFGVCGCVHT